MPEVKEGSRWALREASPQERGRSAPAVQGSMGDRGGDSAKEKNNELKEKAIAAIRAHINFRGKPLGVLPKWLNKLLTTEQFRAHAATLKNDNALATYVVEQVKAYSKKQGDPWDFAKDKKKEGKRGAKKDARGRA